MKISIVTIAYNSADTIAETARTVVGQTHPDLEYIVVDGSSTDETLNVLEPYRHRIARLVSEPDKGIYDAMNKGVGLATGDVIGILNSDDFYADADVLSDVAKLFDEAGAEVDAVYADLEYVDREDPDRIFRRWKSGPYGEGSFRRGWMPPHPTFFVRRSCYERFGDYRLALTSAADYELMLRFIEKEGIKTAYLSRTIIKMRVGGQSNVTLQNRLRANREDLEAWRMNGLKPPVFLRFLKPLRKLRQFLIR